jgi:hypothetical protein
MAVNIDLMIYLDSPYDKLIQGLLEFIWTEECSNRSSNPDPALAILVL